MTDTPFHAPLFHRLLCDELVWHCTNMDGFSAIQGDGWIRPLKHNRWGKPTACQTLGAISLFDFCTHARDKVLESRDRWQCFLTYYASITVIFGLARSKLPGKLVFYPENRDCTPPNSGGPIPWVEVCHVGPIPMTAFATYIAVPGRVLSRFKEFSELTAEDLRTFAEQP